MLSDLLFRLRSIFRRQDLERELAEELALHVERQAERYQQRGIPEAEARRRAQLDLGGLEQVKEECRDARGVTSWETLLRDLQFALRMYRRNPGFTTVVVATLALGLGATTALFGVVHELLLRPLPYPNPDRLVQIWEDPSGHGTARNSVSARVFAAWKEQATAFAGISAIRRTALNLTGTGSAERLRGLQVNANFLDILRVSPLLGRGFRREEDLAGRDEGVVLSYRVWQSKFGADPGVIGRWIHLGGRSRLVIGVLPALPVLPVEADFLVPFVYGSEPWHQVVRDHRLRVIGRIKDNVSLEQARKEMALVTERLKPIYPAHMKDWGALVTPLQEELTREIRPTLLVLLGATVFVLLIACANVANLLLARMAARRREISVRVALGAGRRRVFGQFLTESVGLSLLGGAAGLAVAWLCLLAFRVSPLSAMMPGFEARLSPVVFGFAALLSLCIGLVCGCAPAVIFSARASFQELREGHGGGPGRPGGSVRRTLVVAEIAVALLLLAGAGLLLRTMAHLQAVPLGFNPEGVVTMDVSMEDRYPAGERRVAFCHELLRRIEALPGVTAAGLATTVPMAGSTDNFISVEGRPNQFDSGVSTDYDFVAGAYFRAMEIGVRRGRAFGPGDDFATAPRTLVLSESLARALFAGDEPLGRQVRIFDQRWLVTGIVADVQQRGMGARATHHVYLPQAFSGFGGSLLVRSVLPPAQVAQAVRDTLLSIDPDQPVSAARTLTSIVAESVVDRRLMLQVLGLFAASALALAAIGFYGVLSYSVTLRRQELAIRLALGASRGSIVAQVMREGGGLTAIGVVVGLLGAVALTRVLAHVLFRVTPTDPLTLGAVAVLLGGVALLACYLPARRATRIDPIAALRCD